jgi:NAD(P)H dehydrogenase (quinone)
MINNKIMKTLIIFAHPHEKSHNRRILDTVITELKILKEEFTIIDLCKELAFNPIIGREEYEKTQILRESYKDETIERYRKLIQESDKLIFIYPVWWYGMPAILKGFIDRVFAPRFAYNFVKVPKIAYQITEFLVFIPFVRFLMRGHLVKPLLKGKKALVCRTFGGPKSGSLIFRNSERNLEETILEFTGIKTERHELFNTNVPSMYSLKYEEVYLEELRIKIKNLIA